MTSYEENRIHFLDGVRLRLPLSIIPALFCVDRIVHVKTKKKIWYTYMCTLCCTTYSNKQAIGKYVSNNSL